MFPHLYSVHIHSSTISTERTLYVTVSYVSSVRVPSLFWRNSLTSPTAKIIPLSILSSHPPNPIPPHCFLYRPVCVSVQVCVSSSSLEIDEASTRKWGGRVQPPWKPTVEARLALLGTALARANWCSSGVKRHQWSSTGGDVRAKINIRPTIAGFSDVSRRTRQISILGVASLFFIIIKTISKRKI